MKPRLLAAIALCAAALVTTACKSTDEASAPTRGGDGVSSIQFQDVVVPDGMRLHDSYHESHSIEAGSWRSGHFEYTGKTKVEDASAHLLQRMPQHSWSLVADEQPDQSTRKLKFVRGRYVAEYTLRREDAVTRMVIDYRTGSADR